MRTFSAHHNYNEQQYFKSSILNLNSSIFLPCEILFSIALSILNQTLCSKQNKHFTACVSLKLIFCTILFDILHIDLKMAKNLNIVLFPVIKNREMSLL